MRGDELAEHAQEKYDELLDHIHSTHAHESKYGQINSIKSPLPRPKPPIPCTFKIGVALLLMFCLCEESRRLRAVLFDVFASRVALQFLQGTVRAVG